jgi:hypothetical protein
MIWIVYRQEAGARRRVVESVWLIGGIMYVVRRQVGDTAYC